MNTFSRFDYIDFNKIPIDKNWNFPNKKEDKIHKIHAYPAKFPAFITTKAIDFAKSRHHDLKKIADIFCGCGTVALEAKKEGISFWGCDINPVATLIAKVKSDSYEIEFIERYYKKILELQPNIAVTVEYTASNPRIQYWFKEDKYNELFKLKKAILLVNYKDKKYKDFFLCAFSNILKATSKWLTKSIKPQIDPDKIEKNVLSAFEKQVCFMLKAVNENSANPNLQIDSLIQHMSFIDPKASLPKVDMIVTSPPYVTSYEYADLHQLSSLWLGFANNFTELRKGSIGSIHHLDDFDFPDQTKGLSSGLNETGKQIVTNLISKKEKRKAKTVARYFLDMQTVAEKAYSMLTDKGLAVFVIGNTEYKHVRINNAAHLKESMSNVGFTKFHIVKRAITNKPLPTYRDSVGKFSSNKNSRKVYADEFVIIGEK